MHYTILLFFYHIPSTCCIASETTPIITQQAKPRAIGLAPVLTSLTISVLMPIALMAITIKNLLTLLSKANRDYQRRLQEF